VRKGLTSLAVEELKTRKVIIKIDSPMLSQSYEKGKRGCLVILIQYVVLYEVNEGGSLAVDT
jgi:hypothetical protein